MLEKRKKWVLEEKFQRTNVSEFSKVNLKEQIKDLRSWENIKQDNANHKNNTPTHMHIPGT